MRVAVPIAGAGATAAVVVLLLLGGGSTKDRGGATLVGTARPLGIASCSRVYYGGSGRPQLLIASDFSLQTDPSNFQLPDAVRLVLRDRGFRAGRYRVGYQSCDDSTLQRRAVSPDRCAGNARAYAADPSVIGVVGPFQSSCAQAALAITNRAPEGGVAIVSPSTTYVGLTHRDSHTPRAEPRTYYPTGRRNFVRLVATDDVQGAADALVAKGEGLRHVFVANNGYGHGPYGPGIAADFEAAAGKLGIGIAGTGRWSDRNASIAPLARAVRRSGADGIFLGGDPIPNGVPLIEALRARLGARVPIITPDAFGVLPDLPRLAGRAGEGLSISIPDLPIERLPPAGKRFVARFRAQLHETPQPYAVNTAQAAEVLLDAIAKSDGTRSSVIEHLFATRVRGGVLGDFAFDRNGDMTTTAVTIYTIRSGQMRLSRVLYPPASLVGRR